MKAVYIVLGVIFGLFALAQLLQLLGILGIGFSIAGVGLTLLGGVLSFVCFRKAGVVGERA